MTQLNTVRTENRRTFEYVPLGALKVSATGVLEAPGALETSTPEGEILAGALNVIAGVTSFTGVVVGSQVNDEATGKVLKTATNYLVTAFDSTAKTITLNQPATAAVTKEKITFVNALKAAGAETLTIPLVGPGYQFTDFVAIEVTALEGTAALTLKVFLETSFDEGQKWFKIGTEAATLTEKGTVALLEDSLKEKTVGNRNRLALAYSGAGGFAGYVQLATDSLSQVRVR